MRKTLLLFVISIIVLAGMVSAVTFDNTAYYPLDSNTATTNVLDSTIYANNGTSSVNLNTINTTGLIKSGLLFGGANYFNSTGTHTNYENGTNFTVQAWVMTNATTSASGNIFHKYNGSKGFYGQIFNTTGYVRFTIFGDATTNMYSTGPLSQNVWHQVVLQRNGTSMSLYIDGALNNTMAGASGNLSGLNPLTIGRASHTNSDFFIGKMDEIGIWNYSLTAADISELYNSGNGLPFASSATITLNYPTNASNVTSPAIFNASSTPATYNLSNSTIYVWYSNGTLYNSTTNSLTGNSENSTTWNISFTSFQDNYVWNVQTCSGNGNGTNCSMASANNSFNVKKMIEVNVTYTNPELAGATSTFQLAVNVSNGFTLLVPYLNYNGTNYEGSFSKSGITYFISKAITIPYVSTATNLTFWWNLTLSDSTVFNSSINNQTVNNVSIDNCTAYSNLLFNFTMYEEELLTKLSNTTIEYAFNLYNPSRTTNFLSYNTTSYTNPTAICISTSLTNSSVYSLDGTLRYYANDTSTTYATRYYNFLNYTVSNSTANQTIKLYDVNASNSLPFLLTFRDSSLALAPSILVHVNKQYLPTNDYKTVELPKTDTNGQTILNLIRNTAIYNIIMTDVSGNVVASFSNVVAFCQDYTIGSCSIDLSAPGSSQASYNYSADAGISYSLSYSNSSQVISLAFNSLDSSSKTVEMEVLTNNQFDNRTVCDTSTTTTTGTLTCNVSTYLPTNQYFFVNIYSEGDLISTEVVNTNPYYGTTGGAFGTDGFFIALLLMLVVVLLFSDDKQVLVISLGLGWIAVVSLGLVKGAIIGLGSGGIWLVVTIVIFMWKLKEEETGR